MNEFQLRTFTFYLTIWFALVSGGVSLTHAHAVSQRTCQKKHPASPLSEEVHLHRHLVLFGIEWPYELPPDSSSPPTAKAEWVLLVDVRCDKGCLTDTLPPIDNDCLSLATDLLPRAFNTPAPHALFISAPLSSFALHNSSGVLRC